MECRKIDLSFLGMGEGKKAFLLKSVKQWNKTFFLAGLCFYLHLSLNHLNLNILNPCFTTEEAGPAGILLDFLQLIKECPRTVQKMQ